MCEALVAKQPLKKSDRFRRYLDQYPFALLIEERDIQLALEPLRDRDGRMVWFREQCLFSEREIAELIPASRAEIVERILAKRHATNRGRIHKLLACPCLVQACSINWLPYGDAVGGNLELEWDRVDLEKNRIFLPKHLTKTSAERYVPLTPTLRRELAR